MNNKSFFYVCIFFVSICLTIVFINIYNWRKNKTISNGILVKQMAKVQEEPLIQTSSNSEEKVAPTAKIKMKQHYSKCGHTTENEYFVPEDIINMTKNQVEKYYFGWKVEQFSSSEIVVSKECKGVCDEHYIVRDVEGYVKVFCVDDNNNESLVYGTEISTKYLPKEDRAKLVEGIKIVGKENLSVLLEDYE